MEDNILEDILIKKVNARKIVSDERYLEEENKYRHLCRGGSNRHLSQQLVLAGHQQPVLVTSNSSQWAHQQSRSL